MSDVRPGSVRITSLLAAATVVAASLASADSALALEGPEALPGQHASVVKRNIGEEPNTRACTGTLVDEWWVATAASCFAPHGGPAGARGEARSADHRHPGRR
ncbi:MULTISPECIES: trypsin-like serine protease [Streptomyces]|nr:trypsin-like serine protease [Streptomyces fradiae]